MKRENHFICENEFNISPLNL